MRKTMSAGGVVLNREGLVLVVNQNNDSWSLPKGHVDEGETPRDAARREIFEESGIGELRFVKNLGEYERHKIGPGGADDTSELKRIIMFLFKTAEEDLAPVDPGNPEARWVPRDEVSNLLTHPKDREFFQKVIRKI